MSSKNLAYVQRVICIGLRKMTKDTALIRSGFLYWHKTFADQGFDIDKVVSGLVDYLGVGVDEKKTLMLTLHAASNKLFDELPPVPEVLLNMVGGEVDNSSLSEDDQANSDSDKVVAAKPAHCIVTDEFLHNLVVLIKKHSGENLSELKNILISENIEGLRDKIHMAIQRWAASGFSGIKFPEDTTEDDCYDIAHGIYMVMIEVMGPVDADRIINRAIDETLKIDAATRFSPRNLL